MEPRILVIGSANTDMVVRVEHLPVPGETVMGGTFAQFGGGKGANQAVAARRAGAAVTLLAALGDDALGRQTAANLTAEGIDHALLKFVPGVASGVALIMVDDHGENVIAVAPGANHRLTPEDIERVDFRAFSHVALQLEIPLPTVAAAIARAHQAGCQVILNPAPAAPLAAEVLAGVDVLVPNRGELALLSGIPCPEDDAAAPERAAASLRRAGLKTVIVTLGSAGSLAVTPSETFLTAAPKVKAVDAVGAGDCFTGTLTAGLARRMSLAEAIRFATAAASLSVQRQGAQSSYPRLDAIEAAAMALASA